MKSETQISGTRISSARLDLELTIRGWNFSDLSRASGVSAATLSSAVRGRRVARRTLFRIAVALQNQPTVPGIEALLDREGA